MFIAVQGEKMIETVEDLAREIWNEYFVPMIGQKAVDFILSRFQSKDAIVRQIKEGYHYYLIRENHQAIGYFAVQTREEDKELFLSKLYLKLEKRGKGYGRKVIRFLENMAREKDLDRITLTVYPKNTNAMRIYEKIGFKMIGPILRDLGNDLIVEDYKMEKVIIYR